VPPSRYSSLGNTCAAAEGGTEYTLVSTKNGGMTSMPVTASIRGDHRMEDQHQRSDGRTRSEALYGALDKQTLQVFMAAGNPYTLVAESPSTSRPATTSASADTSRSTAERRIPEMRGSGCRPGRARRRVTISSKPFTVTEKAVTLYVSTSLPAPVGVTATVNLGKGRRQR